MHYSAMAFTIFTPTDGMPVAIPPMMSTGTLALLVALAAFVICGLFILVALPDSARAAAPAAPLAAGAPPTGLIRSPAGAAVDGVDAHAAPYVDANHGPPVRIPYERDNGLRFLAADEIAAIRAEGHYTQIINRTGELFCPWSISRVAATLDQPSFIRTHRSYLVNLRHRQPGRHGHSGQPVAGRLGAPGPGPEPTLIGRISCSHIAFGARPAPPVLQRPAVPGPCCYSSGNGAPYSNRCSGEEP